MVSPKQWQTWLLAAMVWAWPATLAAKPLEQLLEQMRDGPAVRAAEAEQRELRTERQRRADERGWSVFGGVNAGRFQELEFNDDRIGYAGYGAELGLRYPLLGTLRRRIEATEAANLALQQQKHTQALERIEQRLALSNAYIDWWEAQRIQALCNELDALAESELAQMRERAREGNIRQSEQMLLRQRWSSQLRSCNEYAQRTSLLRNRVSRIAGQDLDAGSKAEATPMPDSPRSVSHWSELIRNHPAVESRRSELQTTNKLRNDRWYDTIESSFTLSQRLNWRDDVSGTGTGLVAGVNFEMPLRTAFGRKQGERITAQRDAARLRLDDTRSQLREDLHRALQRYRSSLDEVEGQIGQVALTRRLEAERSARVEVDTEAGFMALRLARLEKAQASFDLIRAWANAWRQQAELYLMASTNDGIDHLLGDSGRDWPGYDGNRQDSPAQPSRDQAANEAPWTQAAYVWNSERLLSEDTRQAELDALQEAGFNRIYLGLSANQINNLDELRSAIREAILEARSMGLSTDLLLGEPTWMEPSRRDRLTALIQKLEGLPFERLHLDLEVEQLGWPVPEERLAHWMETVEAASKASPWPVSLVSHHRWFAPEADSGVCIPCELRDLDIEHISLMIYSTNTQRVTSLARRIAEHWSGIRFQLAQSLEPSLPSNNSWHGTPPKKLAEMNASWAANRSTTGIRGLEWQDWSAYRSSTAEE